MGLLSQLYVDIADGLAGVETPFQEKYANDPCGFASEILGLNLWDRQRDILNSVRDHKYTAVQAAIGTGKTYSAADVALWFLNTRPHSKVVVTAAPPERQIRDLLFAEIRMAHKRAIQRGVPLVGGTPHTMRIIADDNWWVQGFTIPTTGTPEERIAKFHGQHAAGGVLVIADEAHGIPPEIFEAFDNIISGEGCKILLLSNPLAPSGPFWSATRDNDYNTITISAFEHPNVDTGQNIIPGAVDRTTTQRRIEKWTRPLSPLDGRKNPLVITVPWTGEERVVINPVFCYKVLGEFPWEAERALVPLAAIHQAKMNWQILMEEYDNDLPIDLLPEPVCGLDVAEFGADSNCFCARFGRALPPMLRWQGMEIPATAHRAAHLVREVGGRRINIDGIAVGAAVAPLLRKEEIDGEPIRAIGVKVSWSPTRDAEEFQFYRLRDQLGWLVRLWMLNTDTAIYADEDLEADMLAFEYQETRSGLRISTKNQVRGKLMGRSPDGFESLMMTFYTGGEKGRSGRGVETMMISRGPRQGRKFWGVLR